MKPREITSPAALGKAINTDYQIVYCTTAWSIPCRDQYAILEKVAAGYTGWKPIAQVDIDKNPDIAAKLAIQSIPTMLVFSHGKELHRIVGLQSLENLLKTLADFLPVRTAARFKDEIKIHSPGKTDSAPERIDHYGKMHQSSGS
jgi:thioredoxin-like negative regulator of GroEL